MPRRRHADILESQRPALAAKWNVPAWMSKEAVLPAPFDAYVTTEYLEGA